MIIRKAENEFIFMLEKIIKKEICKNIRISVKSRYRKIVRTISLGEDTKEQLLMISVLIAYIVSMSYLYKTAKKWVSYEPTISTTIQQPDDKLQYNPSTGLYE